MLLQVLNKQDALLPDNVILDWYEESKKNSEQSPFLITTLTKVEKFIETLKEVSEESEGSEESASQSESQSSKSED